LEVGLGIFLLSSRLLYKLEFSSDFKTILFLSMEVGYKVCIYFCNSIDYCTNLLLSSSIYNYFASSSCCFFIYNDVSRGAFIRSVFAGCFVSFFSYLFTCSSTFIFEELSFGSNSVSVRRLDSSLGSW